MRVVARGAHTRQSFVVIPIRRTYCEHPVLYLLGNVVLSTSKAQLSVIGVIIAMKSPRGGDEVHGSLPPHEPKV